MCIRACIFLTCGKNWREDVNMDNDVEGGCPSSHLGNEVSFLRGVGNRMKGVNSMMMNRK